MREEPATNHRRHRPSVAIIRRHARLLRARYVDLLQKTLLPSFLLARSRHALFSVPPLRLMFAGCPSFIPSRVSPPLDAIQALLNARIHARTHPHLMRACISRERRSNALLCVQTRMRVRLEPRRWTTPFLSLHPLLPFLTSACSPPALCSPLPLTHSARVRTLRDVRVCQWNTLSLSEGRREDGREGGIGGGTVLGNSGSRSGWWWKTAQSVVTRGTLALHGGL